MTDSEWVTWCGLWCGVSAEAVFPKVPTHVGWRDQITAHDKFTTDQRDPQHRFSTPIQVRSLFPPPPPFIRMMTTLI
jgi:hypothetical protein